MFNGNIAMLYLMKILQSESGGGYAHPKSGPEARTNPNEAIQSQKWGRVFRGQDLQPYAQSLHKTGLQRPFKSLWKPHDGYGVNRERTHLFGNEPNSVATLSPLFERCRKLP